ncbi:MAG: biotin-dependent carboxyltransferase family protein [Ilumatobacteraceae bacterium]
MIVVRSWGIAGSVVDGGHPGRCWLGQSRGGAVDLASLALANRLVGNVEHSGAIESSGGLHLEVRRQVVVAVAGGVAEWTIGGGPPLGWGAPVALPAGATVRCGRLLSGARSYLAVRGGLTDDGGALSVGPEPHRLPGTHPAARVEPSTTIRVWPGPRADWFTAEAWRLLTRTAYVVEATSRVGSRLSGAPLLRSSWQELPSEGLLEGAIQVPPDGQPMVMLADHPTTGGYPVLAVVDPADVGHVAQAAAGTILRFTQASGAR